MFFPGSIRWRLQIWLGVLLVAVLTAFGTTAWQLEKTQRLRRLDDDLEKQAALLGAAIRGPGPDLSKENGPDWDDHGHRHPGGRGHGPGHGPRSEGEVSTDDWFDQGPGMEPPEFRAEMLSTDLKNFFNASSHEGFYYVVWTGWPKRTSTSELAPPEVPLPPRLDKTTQAHFRDRGGVREVFFYTERGDCVLAGRPVTRDLAEMRPVAFTLLLTGLGILALGLGGGWWLTSLSIRPIEDIASAAQRISEKNLSERIPPGAPGSELGALADVLNTTFERLEDSFSQQKRFTSDASHELRTPLTVLISETQTALSRERSAEEYKEVLAGNLDTARQMKRLAEALLELARLDSGDRSSEPLVFDLALVVRERVDRLRTLAQAKEVTLDLDLSPSLIQGSPDRFALVVTNFVENAIHYGRRSGRISIVTGAREGRAILEVSDDGPGIAPEDLPHLFERFYRADKSRSGSGGRYGLGLAICKGMVVAEGGAIAVESGPGQGSLFRASYPAVELAEDV